MVTSSAFYSFTHASPNGERYAIAYKPPGPIERGAYEDLILNMCKGPRMPDAVIVVAVSEDDVDVLSDLQHGSARVAQERLRGRIEPPRDLRRLQLLRRWSHEQVQQVFP